MCVNYLAGFCPEGPKCKFMQYVSGGVGEWTGPWQGLVGVSGLHGHGQLSIKARRVGCQSVSDCEMDELSPSRGATFLPAKQLDLWLLKTW